MTWYCHDCDHEAPTVGKARAHSKEEPVYRGHGKWMRHLLTQDRDAAVADRSLPAEERGKR